MLCYVDIMLILCYVDIMSMSLSSLDGGVSCQSELQWECGSRSLCVDDYEVSVGSSRMTKGRSDNEDDDVDGCEVVRGEE